MQFKRLVAAVCAAAIAVTQTAVIPISADSTTTGIKYKPVDGFTDQFKVTLCANTTTGNYEWEHDAWDGADPVSPTAGTLTLNSSTIKKEAPDNATDVRFSLSCEIDDGYYEPCDEFDFEISGLTVALSKNSNETVGAKEETLSSGGVLSDDAPISIGAYPDASENSVIKVAYSVKMSVDSETETEPSLSVTDTNGNVLDDAVSFNKTAASYSVTLSAAAAEQVSGSGFKVVGRDVTVNNVSISVPARIAEPETEILVNNVTENWTLVRDPGGWFNGNLIFEPQNTSFSDYKDFLDNGSVTVTWSEVRCTDSRRGYWDSANAVLWSGEQSFGNWEGAVTLPSFSPAEKFSRLTVKYTASEPAEKDENGNWESVILFYDKSSGSWVNLVDLYMDQNDDGAIVLDKNGSSITVTLTQTAANALKTGAMLISGCNAVITSVESLEAVPVATVALDAEHFPNVTFREFISEKCDTDKDNELTPIELGRVRSINFNKADEENPNKEYSEEKYQQIDSFKGIEHLSNLDYLSIGNNEAITSLDVSANTKLSSVYTGKCINLADVKLPSTSTLDHINLSDTAITAFDGSNYPSLSYLFLSSKALESVEVSNNTALEVLGIFEGKADSELTLSDLSANPALWCISINGCGISKIDVSKNTRLQVLDLSYNKLTAINLKGLNSITNFKADDNSYHITLTNNKFDLKTLSECGLDPSKVTLADGQDATLKNGIITFGSDAESVKYIYNTGNSGKTFEVTLWVDGKGFDSVNTELWSGKTDFGNWYDNIKLPAFGKAEKNTRLTVEYTVNTVADGSDNDGLPKINFVDNTNEKWQILTDLHVDQDENGTIQLDKASKSITVTLTEEAAQALNSGNMHVHGANITVTSVKSLEADQNAPADIVINAANFPNTTFREFVSDTCDKDKDGKLSAIECSKLRNIDFSKPDENADQTYADEKYRLIDDFTGIEYFTNLEGVVIGGNTEVTFIDVSNSKKLTFLNAGDCTKLEKIVLPEGVKEVYVYNSALKEFDAAKYKELNTFVAFNSKLTSLDLSKNTKLKNLSIFGVKLESGINLSNCPELTELLVFNCGLKKLDVSNNTKLEKINAGENSGLELIGIEKLTELKELHVYECGLKKLNVSNNTKLEKLDINNNNLVALDLTGLDSLEEFSAYQQPRDITLINDTFNLAELAEYGFDLNRVTFGEGNVTENDGGILTFAEDTNSITYTYDTGIEGKTLEITLNVADRLVSDFVVSYAADGKANTAACYTWADVLKQIKNKNVEYTIIVNANVDVQNLTFPTAAAKIKFKSSDNEAKIIKTAAAAVTVPTDAEFDNIIIESTAVKGFTLRANKELTLRNFSSETLTAVSGTAQSTLVLLGGDDAADPYTLSQQISGFGRVNISNLVALTGTVKATTLVLDYSSKLLVGRNSVTFVNITADEQGLSGITYTADDFIPVAVTGKINGMIDISLSVDGTSKKLVNNATVLTSKTADLSLITISADCKPDGSTLARIGSDIKIMTTAFKLTIGDDSNTYALWSDVLSKIAENAKTDKTADYSVILLDDADLNGAFTMPKAGTFGSFTIKSDSLDDIKTLKFIGNIVLTGKTEFENIRLESQKKGKVGYEPASFTITAAYDLAVNEMVSDTLTAVKGTPKSTLDVNIDGAVGYGVTGFGKIIVSDSADVEFTKPVQATTLELYGILSVGNNSVTFTNIINQDGGISYSVENYKPVSVTGNITLGEDSEKLVIALMFDAGDSGETQRFNAGDVVLTSKTANLANIEIHKESIPDGDVNYTLARVGANVQIMAEAFKLSADGNETAYALWSDVLDAIAANAKAGNKTADYTVMLLDSVNLNGAFTMPKAGTFGSLTVTSDNTDQIKKLKFIGNIVLTGKTEFKNIGLESQKKVKNDFVPANFTITAAHDLTVNEMVSDTLTAVKGTPKSALRIYTNGFINYDITGFGTVVIGENTMPVFTKTVKATNLELYGAMNVGKSSVTFTNIINHNGTIIYTVKNYKPVAVTGKITLGEGSEKLAVALTYGDGDNGETGESTAKRFSAGDVILTSRTIGLSNAYVMESCLPDAEVNYTLARVGSDVKVMAEAFKLSAYGDETETAYALWSDVLNSIAANAKAGKRNAYYTVTLLSDVDMNGAFKMPAAKTYDQIIFTSEAEPKTISFTGNISLTGYAVFDNVKLKSLKKVNNEMQSVEFSIAAGNNNVKLTSTDADIKSVTSNSKVFLSNVTVGSVTAFSVDIFPKPQTTYSFEAMSGLWEGKTAPKTSVNITGNLTVKSLLAFNGNDSGVTVGGILNAKGIHAEKPSSTLVLNRQAKGKNALIVGTEGISGTEKINFVLIDPETGKTAQITEDVVLGTIAGPYTDSLVPSNDNLEEVDSYYIIKSGKNLIAKPKAAEGLVTVEINGDTAYYKSLNEAVSDISATGKSYDNVVIRLTQDMFTAPIAKLPLPAAGKYNSLTFKADSEVIIDLTGDITLTGNLTLDKNITINKVKVTGKGQNAVTEVLPISINLDKYDLSIYAFLSPKEIKPDIAGISEGVYNCIENISGTGSFSSYGVNTVVTGSVNCGEVYLNNSTLMLDGAKAAFTGSIGGSENAVLVYDKSISKNIKFNSFRYYPLTLWITDGSNTAEIAENSIIAPVTGDYIEGCAALKGSDLKVVRSGNSLKAIKADGAVMVESRVEGANGCLITKRAYDTVANAAADISRINDKTADYTLYVKDGDTLVLPKAGTYSFLTVEGTEEGTTITTAADLNLTGYLCLGSVTLNKTDKNGNVLPMSVNIGNYDLIIDHAQVSYDAENGVSQFANINGKGSFRISAPMTVSGRVNVGKFIVYNNVTFGSKASFIATEIVLLVSDASFRYPVSIGRNITLSNINIGDKLTLVPEGVKSGDQIAVLKNDYVYGSVVIGGTEGLSAVRSGNKLIASDGKTTGMFLLIETSTGLPRAYDSYANAIADINRLNYAQGNYVVVLEGSEYSFARLTLPAKNKYKSLKLSSVNILEPDENRVDHDVVITVSNDIALTGNFGINGSITFKKTDSKPLKFTSPKNKDGSPVYTVTVSENSQLINATLNGTVIE